MIVANRVALHFLAEQGSNLLPPGVAVLTALVYDPAAAWRGTPPPILNVVARPDIPGTLRYGLELFPGTRRVVAVGDFGDEREPVYPLVIEALAAQSLKAEVEHTAGLTYEEMLDRIANLPPQTLVLTSSYFKDKTGRSFVPIEVITEIAKRANAPVLGMYDMLIKTGLTGGSAMMTPRSVAA